CPGRPRWRRTSVGPRRRPCRLPSASRPPVCGPPRRSACGPRRTRTTCRGRAASGRPARGRPPPGGRRRPGRVTKYACSLVLPPCDVVGDLENLLLALGEVLQLLADVGGGRLFPRVHLTIGRRPRVHAKLHRPYHLQFGDHVNQILVLLIRRRR